METMKIDVLHLGHLNCQYFRIVACEDETRPYKSPIVAILIRHPTLGNILYDTGNSPDHRQVYGSHINAIYPVGAFVSIQDALAAHGLRCADIDMLILSHLHFDHAGGLRYFAGTKAIQNIIVAESELRNAQQSVAAGEEGSAYVGPLFQVEGIRFRPISGTTELAPDLTLFVQQSHTPGVIGIILKTKSMGNVIVTSDTVYTRASWETQTPPGGHINKTTDEFFSNLERLQKLQRQYRATMFFGHDYDQVLEWSQKGTIE